MKATLCFHKVHVMWRTVEQIVQGKKWIVGVHNAVLLRYPALMEGRAFKIASVVFFVMLSNAFRKPIVCKSRGF